MPEASGGTFSWVSATDAERRPPLLSSARQVGPVLQGEADVTPARPRCTPKLTVHSECEPVGGREARFRGNAQLDIWGSVQPQGHPEPARSQSVLSRVSRPGSLGWSHVGAKMVSHPAVSPAVAGLVLSSPQHC